MAVENALQTREHSVNQVIKVDASAGLDVCFLVDTTGSMGDDIDNAKENMNVILEGLSTKCEDFRVALIDYRDFADRAEYYDYPAMLRLDFSQDVDEITAAIYGLDLGNGGDDNETVYSGLMEAAALDWRPEAQKVIIVLGDAPPLDPEPYTGYTYDSIVAVLYNADISLVSDTAVGVGAAADSLINVYTIGTAASTDAADFFSEISEATGGSYTGVDSASEVSDAIVSTIEQIEIVPTKTVSLAFDDDYSGETVELYRDGDFVFEVKLDEAGRKQLDNMELDRYDWSIPRLLASGSIKISDNNGKAKISYDDAPWYAFAVSLWQRDRTAVILYGALGIVVLIAVIVLIRKLKHRVKKPKPVQPVPPIQAVPMQAPPIQMPTMPVAPVQTAPVRAQHRMFCTNCGVEHDGTNPFCIMCGAKIDSGDRDGKSE